MAITFTPTYPLIVQPLPLTRAAALYKRESRRAVLAWMDACLIREKGACLPRDAYLVSYLAWHNEHMPAAPLASSWLLTSTLGTRYAKIQATKRASPAFMDVRLRLNRKIKRTKRKRRPLGRRAHSRALAIQTDRNNRNNRKRNQTKGELL